jgi:tRNA(Ser,Leu) C12 N-acetylase TAN1
MKEWNVVVTVHERGFSQARRLLEQFGDLEKTGFFNILVMRSGDPGGLLESLEELTRRDPAAMAPLARVMPVTRAFTFQSPQEFEDKARQAVHGWVPLLAGKAFHVRMHRRGFKGKLSSMDEERFLDDYLLEALEQSGIPGRITFDDPDAGIALETLGPQAGLSFWTREELRRHPLLRLD